MKQNIKKTNARTKPLRKLSSYLRTREAYWYWITLILAIATTITTFTISEDTYPLIYTRYVLGTIFVLWLPGYSFTRALFPKGNKKPKKSLDLSERITLSLGISLALASIIGLLLNYSPMGLRLPQITLSLLSLTVIFATAVVIREHLNNQGQ